MTTYDQARAEILTFCKDKRIYVHDLARIAKDLSTCDKCRYYCQHYDQNGEYVPFGHCTRYKNRARKPHESSCGHWEYMEKNLTRHELE